MEFDTTNIIRFDPCTKTVIALAPANGPAVGYDPRSGLLVRKETVGLEPLIVRRVEWERYSEDADEDDKASVSTERAAYWGIVAPPCAVTPREAGPTRRRAVARGDYEPDQPREDDGKWAGGGGGGGGPAGERPTSHGPRATKARGAVERKAREVEKSREKTTEAEARHAAAAAKSDEATKDRQGAEAKRDEAASDLEDAEEVSAALEGWDAEEHDEDEAPPTDEDKAAARAKVAVARVEARKAQTAFAKAKRAEAKASNRVDRADEQVGEAEDDHQEALDDHATAMNEFDLAGIYDSTDDEADRSTEIEHRIVEADKALRTAKQREKAAGREFVAREIELNEATRRADDEKRTSHSKADRAMRAGEDEIANRLYEEAERAHKDKTRSIEHHRARAEREFDRVKRETARAESTKGFWAFASDTHAGGYDPADDDGDSEGTAEDRDGDGLTGDEEERDDEDETEAHAAGQSFAARVKHFTLLWSKRLSARPERAEFDPDQPRDDDGKWGDGGGGGRKEPVDHEESFRDLPIREKPGYTQPPGGRKAWKERQVKEHEKLDDAEKGAVDYWTGGHYSAMRELDKGRSDEEVLEVIEKNRAKLLQKNPTRVFADTPAEHLAVAKAQLVSLNSAVTKLTPMPEITVYRGIKGLDKATFHAIRTASHVDMGALSSTSWNPEIADRFSDLSNADASSYRIMFQLKTSSGRPIEELSGAPYEGEVIIPKGVTFKITNVYRPVGWAGRTAVVIEAEEDTEGTAEDRDGDGRTGKAEEEDDDK